MSEIGLGDVDALTTLQRMARALHLKEPDLNRTLEAVVTIAAGTIGSADYASVSLLTRGVFAQRAASADPVRVLGEWEHQHQSGPCTDASEGQDVIRVHDIAVEDRWPGFVDVAAGAGVRSMLCAPLWVEDHQLGSLTLYATRTDAFDEDDERLARVFASYAALALADARRSENLRVALLNRDVIGQAKGILMERHRVTGDRAFELLSQSSQRVNRKLADVATQLVDTGELP